MNNNSSDVATITGLDADSAAIIWVNFKSFNASSGKEILDAAGGRPAEWSEFITAVGDAVNAELNYTNAQSVEQRTAAIAAMQRVVAAASNLAEGV